MQPELEQLQPRLKEILYGCMESVRSTKAALYLLDEGGFVLMSSYGFSDSIRKIVTTTDPVADRLVMRRAPFFINGLTDEPRFTEILYAAGTERMLVAPVHARGKLVGFLDLRDKAGKQPFDPRDIDEAKKIVDQIVESFAAKQIYGQQSVQVPGQSADGTSSVGKTIELGRATMARLFSTPPSKNRSLTESEMGSVALLLPSILQMEGAIVAAFSSFGQLGGGQVLTARTPVSAPALEMFRSKILGWVRKKGESDQLNRTSVKYLAEAPGSEIGADKIVSVLSAPVQAAGIQGLVLSIGLESPPSPAGRSYLEVCLQQIQQTVEHAVSHHSMKLINQKVGEKLIEPDFQKYPHLLNHSRRVSSMAEQFAVFLALPAAEVETIRLAALVHDVGARFLDYQNVYRKKDISDAEMRMLQEHPVIGAALIAESALGPEVAYLVLCHHERIDGKGYPRGLAGEQIPQGSRILHICEAFDAMTAPDSYQVPLPENEAIQRLLRGAGVQFDPVLAPKFEQMLRQSVHA